MRRVLCAWALASLGLVTPVWALPPAPSGITIAAPALGPIGATFTLTWIAPTTPSYRWTAGYDDGSGVSAGTTPTKTVGVLLPYHASGGPFKGWVCLVAVDATGPGPSQCLPLPVPAKPSTPSTKTVPLSYIEPSTLACAGPAPCPRLTNLAWIRAYVTIGSGPETTLDFAASSPTGGQPRTQVLSVPANAGTLTVALTSGNTSGGESGRTQPVTITVGTLPPPAKGAITITTVIQ